MKNANETINSKKFNFILPNDRTLYEDTALYRKKVIVILHLHYIETVEFYLKYIKNIPLNIDIIITTSEEQIEKEFRDNDLSKRLKIIRKNNRGRDISSFLVACRETILQYEFVCFTHDKKAKNSELYEDTQKFINCIWENTLSSSEYINNIISTFIQYPRIGVLVPPIPLLEKITAGYRGIKREEIESLQDLAEKLEFRNKIDINEPIITLGTAYWARVAALKNLFEKEWEYEHFDKEPLPNNGTLSHTIERFFAYAARESGYEAGWVMTTHYAEAYIDELYELFRMAFIKIDEILGVDDIYKLKHDKEIEEKIVKFCDKYEHIYIYGAGIKGQKCWKYIRSLKEGSISIKGFIISGGNKENIKIMGMPVYIANEEILDDNCGIIIAISKEKQNEIVKNIELIKKGFSNVIFFE